MSGFASKAWQIIILSLMCDIDLFCQQAWHLGMAGIKYYTKLLGKNPCKNCVQSTLLNNGFKKIVICQNW